MFEFLLTVTAAQLVAHAIGDYLLQSTWMATRKTKAWIPALVHGLFYSLPFILIFHPSLTALAIIIGTHVVIDRFRLARFVVWVRNWISPVRPKPWRESKETGFDAETPVHVAFWLMVITDNVLHIIINAWALATF